MSIPSQSWFSDEQPWRTQLIRIVPFKKRVSLYVYKIISCSFLLALYNHSRHEMSVFFPSLSVTVICKYYVKVCRPHPTIPTSLLSGDQQWHIHQLSNLFSCFSLSFFSFCFLFCQAHWKEVTNCWKSTVNLCWVSAMHRKSMHLWWMSAMHHKSTHMESICGQNE